MARSGFAKLVLLLLLLAPACAGDDDPGEAGGPADFEEECAGLLSCGCDVGFADASACAEAFADDWAWIAEFTAEAGLVADLSCFKSTRPYTTFGCETPDEYDAGRDPAACTYCQHGYGTRALGEACTGHVDGISECAQGLRCVGEPEPTCIDPCARAGVGESCEFTGCADGLVCDHPFICVAPGKEGEPCAGLEDRCEDGLVCVPEDGRRCRAPAGLGDPCASIPCGEGLDCDSGTGLCAEPAAAGESCAFLECAAGLYCALGQVCEPPGGAGSPCEPDLVGNCRDGLLCDVTVKRCEIPPALGEPCTDDCAADLRCDHELGICVALPGEGEPCHDLMCSDELVCFSDPGICAPPLAAVCVAP